MNSQVPWRMIAGSPWSLVRLLTCPAAVRSRYFTAVAIDTILVTLLYHTGTVQRPASTHSKDPLSMTSPSAESLDPALIPRPAGKFTMNTIQAAYEHAVSERDLSCDASSDAAMSTFSYNSMRDVTQYIREVNGRRHNSQNTTYFLTSGECS